VNREAAVSLIALLGVLAIMFLGLRVMLAGPFGGRRMAAAPVGLGRGVVGRTVASLLSFAVAYRFFFQAYGLNVYELESMIGTAAVVLFAMALLPPIEALVSVAALTLFLMENTAVFGQTALLTFGALFAVYAGLRYVLGR
jgi:hypothetical protein